MSSVPLLTAESFFLPEITPNLTAESLSPPKSFPKPQNLKFRRSQEGLRPWERSHEFREHTQDELRSRGDGRITFSPPKSPPKPPLPRGLCRQPVASKQGSGHLGRRPNALAEPKAELWL